VQQDFIIHSQKMLQNSATSKGILELTTSTRIGNYLKSEIIKQNALGLELNRSLCAVAHYPIPSSLMKLLAIPLSPKMGGNKSLVS